MFDPVPCFQGKQHCPSGTPVRSQICLERSIHRSLELLDQREWTGQREGADGWALGMLIDPTPALLAQGHPACG